MAKYPIYLEIGGRRVLVVGAGSVAARKAESLCSAGAKVLVVARQIQPEFKQICSKLDIKIIQDEYSKKYLEKVVLAIAATNDNELNSRIYKDCKERNVICNVVDVPEFCDFYVPAIVKRGPLQIAVGTDGKSPALSGKIRRQLEKLFTEEHGRFAEEMGTVRQKVITDFPDIKVRKRIFKALVEDESFKYFVNQGPEEWKNYADKIIQRKTSK